MQRYRLHEYLKYNKQFVLCNLKSHSIITSTIIEEPEIISDEFFLRNLCAALFSLRDS